MNVTELFSAANSTASVCLWRLHGVVLDFIYLSAMGVAEIAKFTNYKGCPHTFGHVLFAFSLNPHSYLHPLFVCLRLLSPYALLLVFPLSPAVPFVMLCPDLFCVIVLP